MAGSEGAAFGKYFLMKKIAAGGMGEIYLAKLKGPVGFEKLLVIKRILQHHVENEEFLDMFFAEARVAAQLTHSNIVQIYEMGEIDDSYFIAMEYVHGKSLRDIIDRARQLGEYIPPALSIEIVGKLAAGLSYAHNARDMSGDPLGIIHRDVNPHNVLVSYGGDVKVIDFGIAKSEMSMHKTESGTIKGKFVYMSPEQSSADDLDKRSDLFAVGICLYETLTFVNPFAKANVVLSLDAIQRTDPPPTSETSHKLAPFDPIIRRALAKNAEDRYADCVELRDELQRLLTSGAVPPAQQQLSAFMHDLFEEQIEQEKRMIVETDSANTGQLERMRVARRADASGLGRAHPQGSRRETDMLPDPDEAPNFDDTTDTNRVAEVAAHASIEVVEQGAAHSRLPFMMLLLAIVGSSFAGSLAMVKTSVSVAPGGTALAMAPSPDKNPVKPIVKAIEPKPQPAPNKIEAVSPEPAPKRPEPERTEGRSAQERRHRRERGQKSGSDRVREPKNKRRDNGKKRDAPHKGSGQAREHEGAGEKGAKDGRRDGPAGTGLGNLVVSTTPPLKVTHKGRAGQTFKLKNPNGVIVFGSPADKSKFHVKVSYRVKDGEIVYHSVTAEPWAIVKSKGGIGLGKTPLADVKGGANTLLELLNPKAGLRLRITLRYSPR